MARKPKPDAADEPVKNDPFAINVGEWGHGDDFKVLGVPSGYIVFHGNTSAFVPYAETDPQS